MATTQKLSCRVERIVRHGGRVYTVELRPERPAPVFRPGQFLHLALDPYDATGFWPESRVFSIASSPADRHRLSITYSAVGRFTTRMEAELVPGGEVWVKMPYGDFVVTQSADVVLFAGGTGITAFTAFLDGLTPASSQSIHLAYGARTRSLLIYRDLVERSARTVPSLDVSYFVEEPEGQAHERETIGRVSVAAVWPRIRRPREAEYYISGPPAMLRGVSEDLRGQGVAAKAIHIDAWE
ncbi:MAG: FAD-dependent oxidoreductase [Vicinamibacterales bacterium]